MRALWIISVKMTTWSGVCNSCTLLLYAPGTIGGPALNPTMQRSARLRSSQEVPERDALAAIELCVELGNDIRAADEAGETALHGTAYRGLSGSDTLIRFLVDHGADLNVGNDLGWTPLAIAEGVYFGASDTRSDNMAALLRTLGAEPTPPGVERDVNIARLNAQRAGDRQGGSR